jgi:hypothetical protein
VALISAKLAREKMVAIASNRVRHDSNADDDKKINYMIDVINKKINHNIKNGIIENKIHLDVSIAVAFRIFRTSKKVYTNTTSL